MNTITFKERIVAPFIVLTVFQAPVPAQAEVVTFSGSLMIITTVSSPAWGWLAFPIAGTVVLLGAAASCTLHFTGVATFKEQLQWVKDKLPGAGDNSQDHNTELDACHDNIPNGSDQDTDLTRHDTYHPYNHRLDPLTDHSMSPFL